MDFRTATEFAPLRYRLRHDARLLVMGSCFAEHMGTRLQQMKWRAVVNPFGVLYNPLSIAEALGRLIDAHRYGEDELAEFPDGGWNTWLHHSRYSHPDRREALDAINNSMEAAAGMLAQADWLVLTLGTAWVYRLKEDGRVVGNCHKVPEREFVRQRLSVDEIVETYVGLLDRLWSVNPGARVLLTVSPVRHLKDGLHGNQLSKATLLLGIEEFLAGCPVDLSMNPRYPAEYFPSYEIVMDELRDYRFYAEDMCHPSQQTVSHIMERFLDWALPDEEQDILKENIRTFRHGCHISH